MTPRENIVFSVVELSHSPSYVRCNGQHLTETQRILWIRVMKHPEAAVSSQDSFRSDLCKRLPFIGDIRGMFASPNAGLFFVASRWISP